MGWEGSCRQSSRMEHSHRKEQITRGKNPLANAYGEAQEYSVLLGLSNPSELKSYPFFFCFSLIGSTEKFVSPQKKRKRRKKKNPREGIKPNFPDPDASHKSHQAALGGLCMAATRQNPVCTGSSWETTNFTARDWSDFISSSAFGILHCISQHETLLFVPSFNVKCRERVIFKWSKNYSHFPVLSLCRGWWMSWNPAQFESISQILILWKEEFYYGDSVQTA